MSALVNANGAPGDVAIQHWIRLTSGEATEADRHACAAWRAADPAHERAWARLAQGVAGSVGRLEGVLGADQGRLRRTLVRPSRRRVLLSAAGLLGTAAGGAWVANRVVPLANATADLGTATGERRHYTLPDGSALTLDARSRVDLDFSAGMRRVRLLAGALIAQPRAGGDRAFVVDTPHGEVRSAGASYMVRLDEAHSMALAFQSSIDIENRRQGRLTLAQGQGARFGADWLGQADAGLQGEAAWRDGWFTAHDLPLAQLVAALGRYRAGMLRVSPRAAALRVSGLFPLDDTERALSALVHTVPVSITRYTRWVTLIDVREA